MEEIPNNFAPPKAELFDAAQPHPLRWVGWLAWVFVVPALLWIALFNVFFLPIYWKYFREGTSATYFFAAIALDVSLTLGMAFLIRRPSYATLLLLLATTSGTIGLLIYTHTPTIYGTVLASIGTAIGYARYVLQRRMRSNPSIERTLSGLRPPSASHVKR